MTSFLPNDALKQLVDVIQLFQYAQYSKGIFLREIPVAFSKINSRYFLIAAAALTTILCDIASNLPNEVSVHEFHRAFQPFTILRQIKHIWT